MSCVGFATAAAIPVDIPVLLRSLVQAYGSRAGGSDFDLVIHPEIQAIVEAGTDEHDPWREVTAYYRPYWTVRDTSPIDLPDYVQFTDIKAALAFHSTALPLGTYPRVRPGDPALSAVIKRPPATYRKECATCFYNRQLAADALNGLESLFYGKRGRRFPECDHAAIQTDSPQSGSPHGLPDPNSYARSLPNHVKQAYVRAGQAWVAGDTKESPLDVDKGWEELDFANIVTKNHVAAKSGNPTAQQLDSQWAKLNFDSPNTPAIVTATATNIQQSLSLDDDWSTFVLPPGQSSQVAPSSGLALKKNEAVTATAKVNTASSSAFDPAKYGLEEVFFSDDEVNSNDEQESGSEEGELDNATAAALTASLAETSTHYTADMFANIDPAWFTHPSK